MESSVDRTQIDGLHALASTQHGLFTLGQAAALGISERAVRHAIGRGWVRPVRRAIYAVAGRPPSPWEKTMAAALAAGPNAVVSHASAAAVHRFPGIASGRPEITCPESSRLALSGVRVHRRRCFEPADVETRSGVRLTTPVRTVIDLAASTGDYLLGRILDDGAVRGLWSPERIAMRLERLASPGRSSTTRLRRLLGDPMAKSRADSQLEQRVLRVIKGKVPNPVGHHRILLEGHVIDMDLAWPQIRLNGEIDGLRSHTQRSDFDRERLRANLLGRNDWEIVRWTSTMADDVILAQVIPYFDIR
jgi:Transcriptional regulator, AbiEi antitoxin